uniref:Uncharacterized protein n=1 Tax=Knipowitschia caucasica TaxID=637954 RepID=A0AAV2IZP6_KNICA
MNKDFAVIQGAFLSANRISPLSSLQKTDWDKVCDPILKTLNEINQLKVDKEDLPKTLVCTAWLKLLCAEDNENIDIDNLYKYLCTATVVSSSIAVVLRG